MLKVFRVLGVTIVLSLLLITSISCKAEYRLYAIVGGGQGTVTSSGTYSEGTAVTIEAIPDSGWEFDRWEGDISGNVNPATIGIEYNTIIKAYFVNTQLPTPTPTPRHTSTPIPTSQPTATPTQTPMSTPTSTATPSTSLSRSPLGNCQAMEQYITPNDPSVIAAMNDILNSDWRWAYNDFHALQEWVAWHITYVSDSVAHGQSEYWQLPSETLSLGTGDCEDFAILLCSLLRAYGVPAEDVYVGCGLTSGSGHAFLFEHYYYGQWRAIEPQQSIWIELFLGDLDTSAYSTFYSFNDQDCFSGKPTPPIGVYEVEVGYSFYPLTDAASVEFQRYLNAGQSVTGSVEWYGSSGTTYSWYLDVYHPNNTSVIHWSGTDQYHDFSFTASSAGTYRIKIWKIDYMPRVVTLEVNPPDWN